MNKIVRNFIAVIKTINMIAASQVKAEIIQAVCLFVVIRVDEVDSLLAPFDYTTQPSWHSPKYLGKLASNVKYILCVV